MEFIVIGFIAFITSIISGMIGIGGAIMLIPAYLYIPQLFGMPPLDIRSISGMTTLQVFFSSIVGFLIHRKRKSVNTLLIVYIGFPILLSSFAGAYFSKFFSADLILGIFAFLALLGASLLVIKREPNLDSLKPLIFNKNLAIFIALVVGFLGGTAGAPGAFILSPIMMVVLKIPVRITIGSTLGIVVLSALAASIGKLATNQVPLNLTLVASLFSIPGIIIGTYFSHLLQTSVLRKVLAIIIAIAGLEMSLNLIF